MTQPTLTHQHGYLNDGDDASDWTTETRTNMAAPDATLSVMHGDIYKLQADFDDGVGTTEGFFVENATALNVNHILYPSWLVRYRTSNGSLGARARVEARFQDGTVEDLLPLSYSSGAAWATLAGTFTKSTSELDYLRFYAYGEENTPNGTYYTYYDFALIHKDTFSFPYVDDVELIFENRYADIEIPGRKGDITQYLGAPSPTIRLTGKIDIGSSTSWGTPLLEYLYRIWQDAHNDPWQWFSTGGLSDSDRCINCKVTLRRMPFIEHKDANREWSLDLKMYSLSSGNETTWTDLQWLGI